MTNEKVEKIFEQLNVEDVQLLDELLRFIHENEVYYIWEFRAFVRKYYNKEYSKVIDKNIEMFERTISLKRKLRVFTQRLKALG